MDRKISKEEQRKRRAGYLLCYGAMGIVAGLLVGGIISLFRTSVQLQNLEIAVVERGDLEMSVGASGKVMAAFEEIINSPIASRIVQVYRKGGDSVEVGTPILELDLQSVETEYKKMLDEEQMKRCQLEQLEVDNQTYLSDLKMKMEVSAMKLHRMEVELRNERYLDSLGSGTTDKVRQAELAYRTGKLELEQLRRMYENGQVAKQAELKVKELDFQIFMKELTEMKRTLEDAQIRSPRKAVLTFVNTQVGAQVAQGEQLAVLSDLSHFKVECEVPDLYADRVAVGYKVKVRIGNEMLTGVVSSLTPASRNGAIAFSVRLEDDTYRGLRSGLKVEVYVANSMKEDVLRIKNGSYYSGIGEYPMFVRTADDELVRRIVRLGDSSFEYVEVVEGLQEGEQVVISDMANYMDKNKVKLKK